MPETQEILTHLTQIANGALPLAIAWHVVVLLVIVAFGLGWRPSKRLAAALLVGPVASVSAIGFAYGSPFNAVLFAVLGVFLLSQALRISVDHVELGRPWALGLGVLMVAFGLVYPHFLRTGSALLYLVGAPTGVLPCPTLAVVIGFSLVTGGFGTRAGTIALAAAGVFYGLFGVVRLEVQLDYALLLGAVTLLVVSSCEQSSLSAQSASR